MPDFLYLVIKYGVFCTIKLPNLQVRIVLRPQTLTVLLCVFPIDIYFEKNTK